MQLFAVTWILPRPIAQFCAKYHVEILCLFVAVGEISMEKVKVSRYVSGKR